MIAVGEDELCFWCGALNWKGQPCVECRTRELPIEDRGALLGYLPSVSDYEENT